MKPVGVIANSASGRDIRRLVSSANAAPISDKVSILVRMVRALDSLGVEEVLFMPDPNAIAQKVARELRSELTHTRVETLRLERAEGDFRDSIRSAELMRERGCALIVVMGGDGTCRVVSKGCGDVPILPVSSGTNNVFPQFVEGTLLGLVAAALARGYADPATCCERMPVLELLDADGEQIDTALVDVAVIDAEDIGSRAIWHPESICELFLTRARPNQIGLSSIGGWFEPVCAGQGVHILLGDGGKEIAAPIAPGLVVNVCVRQHDCMTNDEVRPLSHGTGVVALDGEREVVLAPGKPMSVRYSQNGPLVVGLERTLEEAASARMMHSPTRDRP
jgi:predicted polyphosphate/ATP-dependent NAD kinase